MLKYKVLIEHGTNITWTVHIFGKLHATVGDYVREIKAAKYDVLNYSITPAEKTIWIYKKGIVVGAVIFKGDEPISWTGSASKIWGAPVDRCEMTCNGADYTFKIYIKEPREGAYVRVWPIIPQLIDAIRLPIPQGGYA